LDILSKQSATMTTLVAHLVGGGDAMTDLQLPSSSSTSLGGSTKGLMRRQKMQAELAAGTSAFFLQVLQQVHRKMYPARPVPAKEEDLAASSVSMTH